METTQIPTAPGAAVTAKKQMALELHAVSQCYEALKPLEKEGQSRVLKAVCILLDIALP